MAEEDGSFPPSEDGALLTEEDGGSLTLVEGQGTSAAQGPVEGRPACFVIAHSVSKKHNVGTIARCATAFNVKEVCLVGTRQYNTFGSMGADIHVAFRHFPTLEACIKHLKEVEKCEIIGVEITDNAVAVQQHPFTGPTAFMLGNEGQGLGSKQMSYCDKFVYIPQFGCGTASLNVAVAASIVLHHFATWAGYPERSRQGAKFDVADRPQRTQARGVAGDPDLARAERRAAADPVQLGVQEEWASQAMGQLFN